MAGVDVGDLLPTPSVRDLRPGGGGWERNWLAREKEAIELAVVLGLEGGIRVGEAVFWIADSLGKKSLSDGRSGDEDSNTRESR